MNDFFRPHSNIGFDGDNPLFCVMFFGTDGSYPEDARYYYVRLSLFKCELSIWRWYNGD